MDLFGPTREQRKHRVIGYHVSGGSDLTERSISSDGFKTDEGRPVYFWKKLPHALWFVEFTRLSEWHPMIIWKVDLTGLQLFSDPETEDMRNWLEDWEGKKVKVPRFPTPPNRSAVATYNRVGPDRILGKRRV